MLAVYLYVIIPLSGSGLHGLFFVPFANRPIGSANAGVPDAKHSTADHLR